MSKKGYYFKFLGCDKEIVKKLTESGVYIENKEKYDFREMARILSESRFAIVPMFSSEKYIYRGNLKAKICMSFGCCVLASDLDMHKRLIEHGVDGYLVKNFDLLDETYFSTNWERIGENASNKIAKNFSRSNHAHLIGKLANKLISKVND